MTFSVPSRRMWTRFIYPFTTHLLLLLYFTFYSLHLHFRRSVLQISGSTLETPSTSMGKFTDAEYQRILI